MSTCLGDSSVYPALLKTLMLSSLSPSHTDTHSQQKRSAHSLNESEPVRFYLFCLCDFASVGFFLFLLFSLHSTPLHYSSFVLSTSHFIYLLHCLPFALSLNSSQFIWSSLQQFFKLKKSLFLTCLKKEKVCFNSGAEYKWKKDHSWDRPQVIFSCIFSV